jgi:hypothetical protein
LIGQRIRPQEDPALGDRSQSAALGRKDVNLMLAARNVAHVRLPSGNVYRDRLLDAIAHREGELDWAVIAREQQRPSGSP